MGMSTGGKPGAVQSEINITPLIDVVLVLLIIFLVTMPITMKMVTLEVPRKLDEANEMPDPSAGNPITITVKDELNAVVNDGEAENPVVISELAAKLRPLLEKKLVENKGVFGEFDVKVKWTAVVETMDKVRSLASDIDRFDEIKVALKVKELNQPQP